MTKRNNTIVLLGLLLGLYAGLFTNISLAHGNDKEALQNSHTKWQEVRKKINGNYVYKVRWSNFSGFGHETEVVVSNNSVIERRFLTFGNELPAIEHSPTSEKYKWIENSQSLGQHKEGAPAKTLDELYEQAAKIVGSTLGENKRRYLHFDKQGLLRSAYIIDTRIMDDAPVNGVIISNITFMDNQQLDKVYKAPNGKPFPKHWGKPPSIQTRDLRPLPGHYGRGSSTLARWIQTNIDCDTKSKKDTID